MSDQVKISGDVCSCGAPALRVMSYGVPGRLCVDERCGACWGPVALAVQVLPFDGVFVAYPPGGYWAALWRWMSGRG